MYQQGILVVKMHALYSIEHFGSETLVTATHFVSLSPLLPVKSVLSTLKKYDKTSTKN